MSWPIRIAVTGVTALCLYAQTPASETQGTPPRAAATDYPAQAKAGNVTIAAEFAGHAIPAPEGSLSTEDYLVVEVAFYGPPQTRLPLSFNDFSLKLNGRKAPLASQPYERVAATVKDPEWAPPEKPEKSKGGGLGGLTTGGGSNDAPKETPKPPMELQRTWGQRVKKASLAEGERPLPQAGLIYFAYGGKVKSIRSLELLYSGPAGNASLDLQP